MKRYRKTVVGVLYQQSHILLVKKKHWGDWFDFPQGGVEVGESLEEALLRELNEELGTNQFGRPTATGVIVKRSFSRETFGHYPDKGNIGKEQFYFTVQFLGDKKGIRLGDDLTAYYWCSYLDILDRTYDVETTKKVITFMQETKLLPVVS